jgi:hypothetical protein
VKRLFLKVAILVMIFGLFAPAMSLVKAAPAKVSLTATPGCGYVLLKWTDSDSAYQFEPCLVLDDGTIYPLEDFPLVGKYEYKHEGLTEGKEYCYVVVSRDKEANKISQSEKVCAKPICNIDCTWKCGCLGGLVPTAANVVKFYQDCNESGTPTLLTFPPTLVDQLHSWTIDQYIKICIEKGVKPCVRVCVGPNNNIVAWKADIEGNDCCKPEIVKPVVECLCIKLTEINCEQLFVKGTDAEGTPWCIEGVTAAQCKDLKIGQCYKVCGEVIPPGPNEKWSCKRIKIGTILQVPCECKCICVKVTKIQCQTAATNNPFPIFYGTDENGNPVTAVVQDATITDLSGNTIKCEDIKPDTCWKLCGFMKELTGAAPMFIALQAQQVDCQKCVPTPTTCCEFRIKPKVNLPECLNPGQQFSFYFDLNNYCPDKVDFDLVIVNTTPGLTATISPATISCPGFVPPNPGVVGFNIYGAVPTVCQTVELVVQAWPKVPNCKPVEYKISIPCCTNVCCKYDVKLKGNLPECVKPGEKYTLTYEIYNYCPNPINFSLAYTIQSGGVSPLVDPMMITVPAGTFAPGVATFTATITPPANCTGEIAFTLIVIPNNMPNCPKKEIPVKLKCCGTCCQFEIKRMTEIPQCLEAGQKATIRYRLYNTCNPCVPIPYIIVPGANVTVNTPTSGTIPCNPNYADISLTFTMPKPCKDMVFTFIISACGKRTPVEVKIPCCQPCCKLEIKKMTELPKCLEAGQKATVRYRIYNLCDPCKPIPVKIYPGPGVVINTPTSGIGTVPCGNINFLDVSVTFTMPKPCKDTVFQFKVVACDKTTLVEAKIPCCSSPCCKYEIKRTTELPKCIKPGEKIKIAYRLYNVCDPCKPIPYKIYPNANVTIVSGASGSIPCGKTNYVDVVLVYTVPNPCVEGIQLFTVIACDEKTPVSIKIPCCVTLCCDYTVKLVSPMPECLKLGQKYDLKFEICNNCPTAINLALSRCPGTTGLVVNPATVFVGPKDSMSHCVTVTVTIWADENLCKQNNGLMEFCLMTKIISPENCGDKGIQYYKFRAMCCDYEKKNCCQFDVSPLNSPPSELAPGQTFMVKYQVANKGDMATCAPLNMYIKNIEPAGAMVISPMTFTIAAGGMVNLDVKLIMPECKTDKISFSFEIWFEGCEKPAIVKFDVACTQGCKLNLMYKINVKQYWKNGEFVEEMPVTPVIRPDMNDRSFLVIRYVTKHVGATLSYDANQKMVTIITKFGKKIVLWIGNNKAQIDGKEVDIDPTDSKKTVKPFISGQGYTMLPLRFVSTHLGALQVKWHGDTQIAELIFDCNTATEEPVPARSPGNAASRWDCVAM